MNITELLAAVKSASDAIKGAIDLLQQHAAKLDAQYEAVLAHQKLIDSQGPALPPGPISKEA